MDKKASKVIEGEDLNVLVGSMPINKEEKDTVKANILKILNEVVILEYYTYQSIALTES